MNDQKPGFAQMIRAPFLSSIISPVLIGTLLGWYLSGTFEYVNFAAVLILGLCLHIATNVYNDIYDTLQGNDTVNVHRNEFSGGSGVLQDFPDHIHVLYRIARAALIIAVVPVTIITLRVKPELRIIVIALYLMSAFFSKYYTAAPVKLAYRGWGEFSVWLAFGPMAVLVAAVSQNIGFHPVIAAAMPITGISTLSILLVGQMIDRDADMAAEKHGIASRQGNKITAYVYIAVQSILILNVLVLSLFLIDQGLLLLISLIPYLGLLPGIGSTLILKHDNPDALKNAAGKNVLLHLLFSVLFIITLFIIVLIQ